MMLKIVYKIDQNNARMKITKIMHNDQNKISKMLKIEISKKL